MNKTLEAFQEVGANFLAARKYALLADEPGLGKTVQAIAAAEMIGAKRVMVWCPASVRSGWEKELDECLGVGKHDGWEIHGYNYGRMKAAELETRPSARWDLCILDEEHFLKTIESQRTQAIFGSKAGIARRAARVWCLSGTPVLNRPRELYPMLKTLAPAFATMTFAVFAQRYCGAFFDGRSINTKGATNLQELSAKLEGFMLRRTKKQVLPNRTEPIVTRVPVELTREAMAAVQAEEDLIGGREARLSSRHEEFSQLGDTSRLLRLLGEAMVPSAIDFVEEQLETVEKVVVFAHHREVIKQLFARFTERGYNPVVYHGGMSDGQKDNSRDEFVFKHTCRVFIGQRQAAGVGINGLQKVSSTAVIVEPSWVPAETEQIIGRLDRMGQEDELVNAYVMYAKGTLQAVVVNIHDRKGLVVERTIVADPLAGLGL